MTYNLLDEPWIPVQRLDGTRENIAPWQLTDRGADGLNPILSVAAPRPDFNGALTQFLIGLLQTCLSPQKSKQWNALMAKPPTPDELKVALDLYRDAFNLDGEGPRFLQDFEELEGTPKEITALLIDSPGEQTFKQNKDHFTKRTNVEQRASYAGAAMALLTLQTNAPAGGQGHRTSLRGGGPLTTIVLGDDLFTTVWLNVLPQENFGSHAHTKPESIFPWLGLTRTSEKDTGQETSPEDVHPYQMYWAMPRRIRLDFLTEKSGDCFLTGQKDVLTLNQYVTKNYGFNYTGPWQHKLTSHSFNKDGSLNPQKGQPGGVLYRHWLGLVIPHAGEQRSPAEVVHVFMKNRQGPDSRVHEILRSKPRMWSFGYDLDNMKARSWYEAVMPLYMPSPKHEAAFDALTEGAILTASQIQQNLRTCLRNALFMRPVMEGKRVKWNGKTDVTATFFQNIDQAFWAETEPAFFDTLQNALTALQDGKSLQSNKLQWAESIGKHALAIFDLHSQSNQISDADPKAIALARRDLVNFNKPTGKTIAKLLNLEIEVKS